MKKYLLLLVVLLGSVCAYSQNKMVEAIHLKNGSVIKGVIIEQIPSKLLFALLMVVRLCTLWKISVK